MDKPRFEQVYDFENIYQSAKEVLCGKKFLPHELYLSYNLESVLINIQNNLIWHTYEPGPYSNFYVHDPKLRLISAPGLLDRIVQTMVCRVIEPYIDPRLDYDSYACRDGKGTLKAAERVAHFINCPDCKYYLYFDIKKFFESVPIFKLEEIYKNFVTDDKDILWLLHKIFMNECNGIGLKKGCRTSQLSANIYLNELDFHLRHSLHCEHFLHYMDDYLIFDSDLKRLEELKCEIPEFLKTLYLGLNDKTRIGESAAGLCYVGYRIMPDYKLVKKITMDRQKNDVKAWHNGKITDDELYAKLASRYGHCQGTASYKWISEELLKILHEKLTNQQ